MQMEPKRVGTLVFSVLVIGAMLLAAFAQMAPRTMERSVTPGGLLSSRGVLENPIPAVTCGQTPVPLNSSATYAVLANSTVTNTGPTRLTGDLGLSSGTSVTGFPPGTYTGAEQVANASARGAQGNLTQAYNNASGRSNCAVTVAGNLGGTTLTPGLYKSTSSLAVSSGDLTLSGQGNAAAVFIFQVASTLTTTSGRLVILTNGTQAANVFWQVGSSATLGTNSTFEGTIMAYASVTLATGAHLDGRALARVGGVTLASNAVVVPASQPSYSVTFTEGGLPTSTSWSVDLNGSTLSSMSTTVVFTEVNGNYGYTIGAVSGFAATPSSGNVPVSGAAVSRAIAFTASAPATYTVTFTESGLTSGMSWSVTLNGSTLSSMTTTVAFTEVNGSYPYTIGTVSGYTATPSSGSVPVSGAAVNRAIAFTAASPTTYSVTFTESGLPSGTNWSVTFKGFQKSSTATSIGFLAPNGSYTFTVGAVSGYNATPASGGLPVSGSAVTKGITFTVAAGGGTTGSNTTPLTSEWWFWAAVVVLIAAVAAVVGVALTRRPKVEPKQPQPPT